MAKKLTSAQDSIPKQTYFSKNSKGIVSGKSGGDYLIEKMGKKPGKDMVKGLMAKGDKSSAAQAFKSMVAKKAKPNTVKIDSTKKVTPGGSSNPSVIIKKETKIKGIKPIDISKSKNLPKWMKKPIPGVEYKPLPKK
jgi:hypothetical protein